MFRIAIQVKELISSNVTTVLDNASNPAKMLGRLQREIEEALIGLTGEITKAQRQQERLKGELTQAELREADWSDKAKIAMDNKREDLARQALHTREDCRATMVRLKQEMEQLEADIADMRSATAELEIKREDVRTRLADERAAQGCDYASNSVAGFARRTARRMDHIEELARRTEFATGETAACRGDASISREIEEMRREREIDEEIDVMRDPDASKSKPTKKPAARSKAA